VIVVADASVLVPALADTGPGGEAVRRWLIGLAGSEQMHVVQTLTQLEVVSSLHQLVVTEQLDKADAERAIRDFVQLPVLRHEVTQPMVARIWEMRPNVTPYDAAYVALVERLESEHKTAACLATADVGLHRAPGLSIDVELFVD
jgi:predicted nucleic acid-binding protein